MNGTPRPSSSPANETPPGKLSDFSPLNGGPLYNLLRRARLTGAELEMAPRRVLVAVLLAWPPLLVLSIVDGHAWGGGVAVSFLRDIETHLRMLIAMPLLILGEVIAYRALVPIVAQFERNGLIGEEARPRFDAAIESARRLRNSVVPELLLIVLVYAVGVSFVWRDQVALDVQSWFASPADGRLHPTLAGWWLGLVSMPLLQFLLLRWFFRIFIWGRFLRQVARSGLSLEPNHPDRTAGLLFLARGCWAFRLVLLAFGTLLSGTIASRIFQDGATLIQFQAEILGTTLLALIIVLGPLVVFHGQIRAARERGMIEYGALGQVYAREFDRKWLHGPLDADQPLLGHPDFQSLADLQNGFEHVRTIRIVPFSTKNVASLVAFVLLPVAPLVLTMVSVEQLLNRVLKTLL